MLDVQAGFRKGRGTRDLIASIQWTLECSKEFWKKVSLCFINYNKAFDCVDHEKLWVALKEREVYFMVLMWNLCYGQAATVRTEYGAFFFSLLV